MAEPITVAGLTARDPHEEAYITGERGKLPDDHIAENIRQYRAINSSNRRADESTDEPPASASQKDVPAGTPYPFEEFLTDAKPLNPDATDQELASYWADHYKSSTPTPKDLPTLDNWLKDAKPQNPDASEQELKAYWDTHYGIQGAGETPPGFGDSFMQGMQGGVKELGASAYGTVERLQDVGDPLKKFASDASAALSKDAEKFAPPSELQNQPWYDRLRNPEFLGNFLGNMLVQSAPSLGGAVVGGMVGGPVGAAAGMMAVTYFQQAGQTYRDAFERYKQDGMDEQAAHEKAYTTSGFAGLVSGAVNALAVPASLVAPFTSTLKNLALNYGLNVAVDTGDQLTQNVLQKATYKPEQELTAGIPEAVVGSAILGGPETIAALKSTVKVKGNINPPNNETKVGEILKAGSVDEAIAKTKEAVDTPAFTTDHLDAFIKNQQADGQVHLDQVAAEGDLATQSAIVKGERDADQQALVKVFSASRTDYTVPDPFTTNERGESFFEGAPIEAIHPSELPDTTPLDGGLSKEKYEVLNAIAQALGKRVVIFGAQPSLPEGVVHTGDPSTIFLSSNTQAADLFSILTHEAIHLTEGTTFHEALRDVVWATMTPEAKQLAIDRHGSLPHTELLNEIVADISGTELHKPEVWEKVFRALQERTNDEKAKTEMVGFIDTLKSMLAKVKELIATAPWATGFGNAKKTLAEQYVKDLTLVHDALAEGVANVIYETRAGKSTQSEKGKLALSKQSGGSRSIVHPEAVAAFTALATEQRGSPETAMLNVQKAGVGVMNPVVEHVGDLIHRMTEGSHAGVSNKDVVTQKLDQSITMLTHAYGFEQEHHENLRHHARARHLPVDQIRSAVDAALLAYANEHRKLPVYNQLHWLAREASVAVGEQRFEDAVAHLKDLKKLVSSGEYDKEVFRHEPGYLRPIEAKLIGIQRGIANIPDFELYNLESDIPGHPAGSTVSRETIEEAGYKPVASDLISRDEAVAHRKSLKGNGKSEEVVKEEGKVDKTEGKSSRSSTGHPIVFSKKMSAEAKAFAKQYDDAPVMDKAAVPAWNALKAETDRLYSEIVKKVKVERVTGQPYPDAKSTNEDIAKGRFKVTTDHSEHPVWNVEENFKFRVVHDYLGHFGTDFDFSLEGERQAYEHHAKQLKNALAKDALKVEVYGQAAAGIAHGGEFQPQKIFLPKADVLFSPKQPPIGIAPDALPDNAKAPKVQWDKTQAQENLPGTPSDWKDSGWGTGTPTIYQSYLSNDEVPRVRSTPDAGNYDYSQFKKTGVYPPMTVVLHENGVASKLEDGHHRMTFWRMKGFDHFPAWIVDFRKPAVQPARVLFSPKIWFSTLGNTLNEKMPNKASKEQVQNLLKSPGVKEDEVKWTGIQDYLDAQPGVIDKQALLAWLKQNDVRVNEVTKRSGDRTGDEGLPVPFTIQEFVRNWDQTGRDPETGEETWTNPVFPDAKIRNTIGTDYFHVQIGDKFLESDGTLADEYSSTNAFNSFNAATEAAYEHLVAAPAREEADARGTGSTQYEGYKLPGGTDYTELLLTLGQTQGQFDRGDEHPNFTSPHFDEKDILAHVRFDTRKDADGKSVLFLEEVQSDWHEKGREQGYRSGGDRDALAKVAADMIPEVNQALRAMDQLGFDTLSEARVALQREGLDPWDIDEQYKPLLQRYVDAAAAFNATSKGVPDAPFKTTWPELVMKRMLRWASEHNYDRLAWTTGAQQNDRYGLAKTGVAISYFPNTHLKGGTYNVRIDDRLGRAVYTNNSATEEELNGVIGRELTRKIVNGEGRDAVTQFGRETFDVRELSGLDLEVGGSGMKYFYDQMLPRFMEKYLKRFGTKVSQNKIETDQKYWLDYVGPEYTLNQLKGLLNEVRQGPRTVTRSLTTGAHEPYGINNVSNARAVQELIGAMENGESFAEAMRHQSLSMASLLNGTGQMEKIPNHEGVHSIDLTPEMKDSVINKGQPLFSPRRRVTLPPPYAIEQPGPLDKFIRLMQDKTIDIKRIVEDIKKAGHQVHEDVNPVLREEMYQKRAEQRSKDFTVDELRPLLDMMRLNKVTIPQIDDYLHARHVIDDHLNARLQQINPDLIGTPAYDKLSGITDAEAQAILARSPAIMGPLANRVDQIVNKTRDLMVDYGLEKQSRIDEWRQQYSAYVPLRREGFDERGYPTGQGYSVRGSTVNQRSGSGLAVENILANIAQARDQIITRGEKQKPVVAFAALMMLYPNKDLATLDKPAQITMTNPASGLPMTVPGNLTNYQVPTVRRFDKVTGTMKSYPDPTYKGRDNVVNFRVKGIDYAIVFNEKNVRAMEAAKAFKNIGTEQLNRVMQAVAPYTRYLAAINTQYNPIFGIVNFIRDSQYAMLTLGTTPLAGKKLTVLNHARKALAGIYQDARNIRKGIHPSSGTALDWEEFQEVGGPTGYRDLFFTASDRAKEIERMLNPKTWKNVTSPAALGRRMEETPLFKWLSDYNTTMENSIRLGVYITARDMGIGKLQAASYAKNITVNFNKKGQIGAQMGALYAFFNANVQGTARIAETLFEKTPTGFKISALGGKIITGGILVGILQTFALTMAGMDDDDPPEFVKQKNLIFPVFNKGKDYGMLPMPLGFNLLPNIGRLAAESVKNFIMGKPPRLMDKAASLFGSMFNALSPTGGSGGILQELAPTVADPIAALATNTDWTGRSIAKEDHSSLKPTPGHTRAHDTATAWAKGLSYAINWATGGDKYEPGKLSPTPDSIDYVIQQATGGVGREVSKIAQGISSLATGETLPTHKIPLAGRFVGSATGQSAIRTRFYENVRKANIAYEGFEGRAKDHVAFDTYLQSHPEARYAKSAVIVEKEVSVLQKQKQQMIKDGANRTTIKLQEERISSLMSRFNELVEQAGQ